LKKQRVKRYDLDKVYFMGEYNKTVAYGNQNINIEGVREQLQKLESEKESYFKKVASIVDPERDKERVKYQQYEKWEKIAKKCKWLEIMLILLVIAELSFYKLLPVGFRTSALHILLEWAVFFLAITLGPIAFLVSKIAKHCYGIIYNRYVELIANNLNSLGSSFQRASISYYDIIDSLYLGSLEPVSREVILLRRQQEKHEQDMVRLEKQRQRAEEMRLIEQKRTRQATEELLSIEREREKRYRRW